MIEYFRNGRKTGNANVDFNSARDAKEALKKHKAMMGMIFSLNITTVLLFVVHLILKETT